MRPSGPQRPYRVSTITPTSAAPKQPSSRPAITLRPSPTPEEQGELHVTHPESRRIDEREREQDAEGARSPDEPAPARTGVGRELGGGEHDDCREEDAVRQDVPLEVDQRKGDEHAGEETGSERVELDPEAHERERAGGERERGRRDTARA